MNAITNTYTIGGDLTVRRLGFGAMRITGEGVWGPPKDKAEAIRVLQTAVSLGVNFIDTADCYGPNISEALIAEALYPYAPGMVIATKGGLTRPGPNKWAPNGRPDHLKQALEGSLKLLKLDRIDLYQLHRIDPKVPLQESLAFLQEAVEKGLIKHVGLSEVSVEEIKKAQAYLPIASVQNKYSVDSRTWEPVLQYTAQEKIAFIPWYPLNAGNVKGMEKIAKIADALGATPHQVALAWLLHHSPNILLIPGTSSVKHLEENMGADQVVLGVEHLAELDALSS